jgi:hypothetical protein
MAFNFLKLHSDTHKMSSKFAERDIMGIAPTRMSFWGAV